MRKAVRRVIQIVAFLLFPGIFTTIFYAIKTVYSTIMTGSFSLESAGSALLITCGIFVITMLFGRVFCGYLCSFGAMADILWFLSMKTIGVRWRMPQKLNKLLKAMKFVVLLLIVIAFWTIQYKVADQIVSPWTVFGMYSSVSGWQSPQYLISIGGLILLIIMFVSLFVERFFCRYLCPLGAVFALLARIRPFYLKKNREKCGACRACTNNCPMGIALYEMDEVISGECIQCYQCKSKCPRNNISIKPHPVWMTLIAVAAITSLMYAGEWLSAHSADPVADQEMPAADEQTTDERGPYQDGTYSGTGRGFKGDIMVSVTVENGYLTHIEVVDYGDDREYFTKVENTVIAEILSGQDTEVDTVAGATFSSQGIIEAVKNALQMNVAYVTETQPVTETESETQAVPETSAQNGTGNYTDGVYTGTGTGFRGETDVQVTVENHQITDITVTSYEDDEPFFERAKDAVIQAIMNSQDVEVDAVSGATFSSNSIKEAVANALNISYENPNQELEDGKQMHNGGGRGRHKNNGGN